MPVFKSQIIFALFSWFRCLPLLFFTFFLPNLIYKKSFQKLVMFALQL